MDRALGNPLGNPLGLARMGKGGSGSVGVIDFFESQPDDTWLPADGRVLKQSQYPLLFKKLGFIGQVATRTKVYSGGGSDYFSMGSAKGRSVAFGRGRSVRYSVDFGETWALYTVASDVSAISMVSEGVWLVCTLSNGLYRTTNYGTTWVNQSAPWGTYTLSDIASDGEVTLISCTHPAAYYNRVLVSTDAMQTYATRDLPQNTDFSYNMRALYIESADVWLGKTKNVGNIVRTNNAGVTWSLVKADTGEVFTSPITKVNERLFSRNLVSEDLGLSWTTWTTNNSLYGDIPRLADSSSTHQLKNGLVISKTYTSSSTSSSFLVTGDFKEYQKFTYPCATSELVTNSEDSAYFGVDDSEDAIYRVTSGYTYDKTTEFKLPNMMVGGIATTDTRKVPFIKVKP